MGPESLPLTVGLASSILFFRAVYGRRPPFVTGLGLELSWSVVVFVVVTAILRAVMVAEMEHMIISTVGGAIGGSVLGLGIALTQWISKEPVKDCIFLAAATTGIFAALGFIAGGVLAI